MTDLKQLRQVRSQDRRALMDWIDRDTSLYRQTGSPQAQERVRLHWEALHTLQREIDILDEALHGPYTVRTHNS